MPESFYNATSNQQPDLILPAPAKLNLFLHIVGQRSDGYHLLESLFQYLDYSDTLSFWQNSDNNFQYDLNLPDVPTQENIIVRAVELLKPYRSHPKQGIYIKLQKKLPLGGGLGGGSSNAATTLLALNKLWELNLSQQELTHLGLQLGADVPFFLYGKAAYASGIGEQLTPASPDEAWYLVLVPAVNVSTAAIFKHPRLIRDTPSYGDLARNLPKWQQAQNDCEPLVKELYPSVAKAYNWLLEYKPTRMTGTGACLFAVFSTESAAKKVFSHKPAWLNGFIARGLNKSPAFQALTKTKAS